LSSFVKIDFLLLSTSILVTVYGHSMNFLISALIYKKYFFSTCRFAFY
jgi:hypothetical protein